MCFVLRGSHCPHKHTRTGFFPPRVCGVSVLSHYGRVSDSEYRQGESWRSLPAAQTLQNVIPMRKKFEEPQRIEVEK